MKNGKIDVGKLAKALSRVVNEKKTPDTNRRVATESLVKSTISLITTACNASILPREVTSDFG